MGLRAPPGEARAGDVTEMPPTRLEPGHVPLRPLYDKPRPRAVPALFVPVLQASREENPPTLISDHISHPHPGPPSPRAAFSRSPVI